VARSQEVSAEGTSLRYSNLWVLYLGWRRNAVGHSRILTNKKTPDSIPTVEQIRVKRSGTVSRCVGLLVAVLVCSSSYPQAARPTEPQPELTADSSGYVPVRKFDPKRNAAADIQAAVAEARRTGKRVIVDVGGDWCQYCHQMDQLFQKHPELGELREKNFITVAVYYGSDKKNEQALSRYPKVNGIPHFYVLDGSGSVLHSQHLTELRTGANYDPDKVKDFLTKWSPSSAVSSGETK